MDRNRKYKKTNHKYWNINFNLKILKKKKKKFQNLHSQIQSNILGRANIYPSETI